jgi:hypothetical protein
LEFVVWASKQLSQWQVHESENEDGHFDSWIEWWVEVILPSGQVLAFNYVPDGSGTFWIDANHWGANRQSHLAPMAALGVEWVES